MIMTLYTAVRYRNDMSVFDHHTDGIVRPPAAAANKPAPLTLTGSKKTFSVSQVRLMISSTQIISSSYHIIYHIISYCRCRP